MDIIGGLALGGSILGSKDDINIKSKNDFAKIYQSFIKSVYFFSTLLILKKSKSFL